MRRPSAVERQQRTFPQLQLPLPLSVCDLEHDLSGLVGRAIQHAVGDFRVREVKNLADRHEIKRKIPVR
jgi:hypothetical protein